MELNDLKTKPDLTVILWIICISSLVLFISSVFRHELFNSSGDLAFFDQVIYLSSQGENPISSVWGFHLLADHAAWILYFIVFLYKIYPSIYWLFFLQSIALSLGVLPIYLLAIQSGLKSNQIYAIVFVYLLFPVIYNSNLSDFHPDTFAVPALLTAIFAARSNNIILFCFSIFLVLGCKAVLALTVIAMGVWLLLFEKRVLPGGSAIIFAVAWFLIANKIIIPFFGNETALVNRHFYRYSYLGNSFAEMWSIIIFHPENIFKNIFSLINLEYLVLLLIPVIWGLKPKYMTPLIGAIPCIALNILASHNSQKNVILHYSLPAIPFLMLTLITSLKAGKTWIKEKKIIILWSLIWFLALGKFWLFTSTYIKYRDTWSATKEAIALINTQNSVLTTDIITPHLTHRKLISLKYDESKDVNTIDNSFYYILLNIRHPGYSVSASYLQKLVNYLKNNSNFKLKYQKDDVYLFVKDL